MNATSIFSSTPPVLGLLAGCAMPLALVGCLLTAPAPQPAPVSTTPPPPPTAAPAPTPRTPPPGTSFSEPPRPLTPRQPPAPTGTISPSSARAGAQIAVFANFATAAQNPQEVQCWFEGAGPVKPVSVRPDRLVVQIPATARSGNLRVTLRRRLLFSGAVAVVQQPTRPPAPTAPAIDCQNPPSMMCCKAMTEACMSCARRAQEARAAWDAQCSAAPAPAPAIDCSKPPPRRACCRALLPACTECQKKATEENRRWDAACRRR